MGQLRQRCADRCCGCTHDCRCADLWEVLVLDDYNQCGGEAGVFDPPYDHVKPFSCVTAAILTRFKSVPSWLTALLLPGETLRYVVKMSAANASRISNSNGGTEAAMTECQNYWYGGVLAATPEDFPPDHDDCTPSITIATVDGPAEQSFYNQASPAFPRGLRITRSAIDGHNGWSYPETTEALECSCHGRPGNLFLVVEARAGGVSRHLLTCVVCIPLADSCIPEGCCGSATQYPSAVFVSLLDDTTEEELGSWVLPQVDYSVISDPCVRFATVDTVDCEGGSRTISIVSAHRKNGAGTKAQFHTSITALDETSSPVWTADVVTALLMLAPNGDACPVIGGGATGTASVSGEDTCFESNDRTLRIVTSF